MTISFQISCEPWTPFEELRRTVDLTQAELHALPVRRSQRLLHQIRTKSPTLRTLSRMARAVGLESVVAFPPAMTREDRRSLALHRAIADRLKAHPVETLDRARRNLTGCEPATHRPLDCSTSGTTS